MEPSFKKNVQKVIMQIGSPFGFANVSYHTHNGVDSPQLKLSNIINDNPQKIYGGSVADAGTPNGLFPIGWSSIWNVGTSEFIITHNLNSLNYAVTTVVVASFGTPWVTQISSKTTTNFRVKVITGGGSGAQKGFDFVLVFNNP